MQVNIEGGQEVEQSFFFQPIPNKTLQDKTAKEILMKWGLADTLKVGSFRFNQHFQQYDLVRFLSDLFNNPNVRYVINNLHLSNQAISSVQYDKLRCHELTMELFEQLEKEGIVKKTHIAKIMPEYFEEIEICDKLRECLVLQESESYCVFNESQRREFLMKIFQLLVIGGSFNQYEDIITPYLEWTKRIYKSLVSVRKKSESE